MARSERRSVQIPQLQIAREHIFQDEDQDTDLDKQLKARVNSEGGEYTRWWSQWQSTTLASDEPDVDVDMRDLSQTAPPVSMVSSTSASSRSSRPLSSHKKQVSSTSTLPKTRVASLRRTSTHTSSSASSSKSQASIVPEPVVRRPKIESSSPDEYDPGSLPHKSPYQTVQKLKKISDDWNKATSSVGAASIRIVNDLDNDVLSVPQGFQYLEKGYYSEYNKWKEDEFMSGCSCSGKSCKYPEACCVNQMDTRGRVFPYSELRLFTFAIRRSTCIIECNKRCLCDETCRNRVAQKPRQVPLEIFKTARCGWGVRATVAIQRGQVIGTYSGELIKRSKADTLSGIRGEYVFDLDHLEGGDGEPPPEAKFSVDGYEKGNWGRFINHSCEPNLQVWPVLYDTAEQNKPYLAFIAKKYIPARVELTLDYTPGLQYVPSIAKGKGKAQGCLCGSLLCRGQMS